MSRNLFDSATYKASRTSFAVFLLMVLACVPVPRPAQLPLATLLSQADTLMAAQQYGAAIEILEQAAGLYPDTTLSLIKIGQIYLKQHRWLLAEDAFNRALARDPDNAVATAGLAEVTLSQGSTIRALQLWQRCIELNPELPGVFTGLGRTHLARLEFEPATAAFLTQLKTRPDPEAQWYLGVLAAPEDLQAARDYLLAIPDQSSPDILARRDYLLATLVPFTDRSQQAEVARATGIALVQAELWPLAVHALTNAHNDSTELPDTVRAELLAFLGHALAQAGRPALDLFDESLEFDPDSALPRYFYGMYLRRQGALKAAEKTFQQAIELDPQNAAIYIEMARTKAEQGDFAGAETQYEHAVANAEEDLQVQLSRVRFHANRGYNLLEAGIPAAENLVDAYEENAEAYDLLGWMQFLAGEPDKAEQALRRALELDSGLISAHYHLARQLEAEGQPTTAIEQYQLVIDRDSSGLYRERALKDLQRLTQAAE
jgi:tetratricopeptide (TPR) repeat protein